MRSPPPFEVVVVPSPDQVPAKGANGPLCAKAGAAASVNPATTSTQPSGLTERQCMWWFPFVAAVMSRPGAGWPSPRAAEFTDDDCFAQGATRGHCEEPEGRRRNPGAAYAALDRFATLAMTETITPPRFSRCRRAAWASP